MISNKKLMILCILEYFLVLVCHIVYSIFYCSKDQTVKAAVWSVCILIAVIIFTYLFKNQTGLVIYFTAITIIASTTYIGYVLHTLPLAIMIFFTAEILLGIFYNRNFILSWIIMSSIVLIAYGFLWPDIILELFTSILLYNVFVLVYIVGSISLSVLVLNGELYIKHLSRKNELTIEENELKNLFWANISNEIKTPMNVINGMTRLLKSENLNSRASEYADQIENASEILLSIVSDTLELTSLESGYYVTQSVCYDLYNIVHNSVLVSLSNVRTDKISIIYCINPDVPRALVGDNDLINKLINRLINNLILMTEKGEIRVEVSCEQIFDNNESDSVKIIINVTKKEYSEKDSRMLSYFKEIDESKKDRTTEQESMGLSFKLCKAIIDIIGGDLSFSSDKDNKTYFSVSFNQKMGTEEELIRDYNVSKNYSAKGWKAPQSKVLVVDDTPTNLKLITGMIKLHGIEPDSAKSGKEALQLMEKQKYDMVFLDYMMPEMNGVETFRQIKARMGNPNFNNIPIIALSSKTLQKDKQSFIEIGFDDFISKPIDDRDLEGLLKKYLENEENY